MNAMLKRRRQLLSVASAWNLKVRKTLQQHGVHWFQQNKTNQLRLLNWKVWCLRYGVTLDWIIQQVLFRYQHVRQARGATGSLGIQINAITGERFRQYIEERAAKDYPNGEQLEAQRSEQQARMLAIPRQILKTKEEEEEDLDHFITRYQTQALKLRQSNITKPAQFKRPFRGNPWL
jgi:hypothetical protein